ncbi:hypothetical protein NA57DRAFT_77033 [Rhizodiscina lignyota]|uniref:Uncharacterized protein n=1 Tax=Rhizodiscina lignyota TaxID=1504668 RepID=A0A9P4IAG3_9PEZI|nr:hypothetical protein NA57DRAFT_77033 [Rhizodiscina lignyota]
MHSFTLTILAALAATVVAVDTIELTSQKGVTQLIDAALVHNDQPIITSGTQQNCFSWLGLGFAADDGNALDSAQPGICFVLHEGTDCTGTASSGEGNGSPLDVLTLNGGQFVSHTGSIKSHSITVDFSTSKKLPHTGEFTFEIAGEQLARLALEDLPLTVAIPMLSTIPAPLI